MVTQNDSPPPVAGDSAEPQASILIVDDRPANLLALEAVLGELGHPLVRAGSGEDALRLLAACDFAVVLLDVRMHGMDGFQTARHARTRDRSRHTPIIFLTAEDESRASLEEAYSLGAVDYLVKPIITAVLRAKVAAFVDLFRQKEELRRLHGDLERRVEERAAALVASTEALRESEARKAAILATALDGILTIDHDGTLVEFNPAAEAMFGYRRGDVIGREMAEFIIPPPLRDAHRRGMARYLETGEGPVLRKRIELTALRADGSEFPVELAITPIPGGDRPVFTGFVRDITQRKATETALRTSEEQFRTLADSIPQLAWTARPDGHIYWYNRRWYEYTGTTPEGMEGWGWQAVHDPEELPAVLARWKGSIASGEPFEMVFPLKGGDGVFRPFLTRVVPVRGDDGRVLRWFGTNTDISAIKAMEDKLRDADRRKDQWVMMLAHELRNPLVPIRNGLELLRASDAGWPVVEKARRMMDRQVGHLTRIIEDLLDVSRLIRGRVELRPERLDLGRAARTAVEDLRPSFDRAGVALDVVVPEVPVWVNGDPTRLTQVLDNLLQNAAKFTDRGGRVAVRVEVDAGRGLAVLAVRDTGVGIEPDLLPRLFETFTQADRSLDRSKGGLGLGLSVVKGLVHLHGGTVEARSDGPGRGAEFVVRLPLQPEPSAVTAMPTTPGRAPERLRVLVVEDNRDAADSLQMLLEVFGHEVAVAYTGPDGVAAAKEMRPDAVVCDIGLPGLDGYGVARVLRQDPATAKARMIAVTGYGGDDDRLRSREAGFDAHLTKPADAAEIQRLLAPAGGN